ncbi:MAG: hypothetical protein HY541_03325 [Deltaproteobacteria bacterium]|nr:hypothetical protein [Deltaproteobacteria bacterium]
MSQLNINVTPEFARDLSRYMKKKGIRQKSEAIRQAVRESIRRLTEGQKETDFNSWLGMALKAPLKPKTIISDDDLWETKKPVSP